jgi:translation initiation factor 2B subunit (eIF-2B alpha/beta/delta family)
MDLDALITPLREDVQSGAVDLARCAAGAFEHVIERSTAPDVESLRAELAALAGRILDAQPAVAPLVGLSAAVVRAASGTVSTAEARREAKQAVAAFRQSLDRSGREVAARAEGLIPAGGHVLTLSSSSTVRSALLEAARRRSFEVICLESRPGLEGREMAAALAGAGVRVTLAVDAAIAALIRGCDIVVIGADAIGDLGIVNKIGTRVAALAARGAGVPAFALADTSKLLPPSYPPLLEDDRPPGDVWDQPPEGVHVWNRYFEATPLTLFEGVVTELGLKNPAEIERLRSRLAYPAELRRRPSRR